MPSVVKAVSLPLRRYFNPRFEALSSELSAVRRELGRLTGELLPPVDPAGAPLPLPGPPRQAEFLARVDVSEHNRGGRPPQFTDMESRAVSAAQCLDAAYLEWFRLLEGPQKLRDGAAGSATGDGTPGAGFHNRKVWEWACVAEAASQAGLLRPGARALGFGVGNEPLPALLASRGLEVLATDQPAEDGAEWASTGQLMNGLEGLSRPHLLDDAELARRVSPRAVDMNAVPDDLGSFDLIWSSCCIEHLGTPQRGLDFVLQSSRMLRPGGVAVHTTELELTRKEETADYGHCAVYRLVDLVRFTQRALEQGYETSINPYVSMDTPQDRWISLLLDPVSEPLADIAHLKLVIADSVSTSFALVLRRPQ